MEHSSASFSEALAFAALPYRRGVAVMYRRFLTRMKLSSCIFVKLLSSWLDSFTPVVR